MSDEMKKKLAEIEVVAKELFAMVDRVKSQTPEAPKQTENWAPSDEEMAALDAQAPMPSDFLRD